MEYQEYKINFEDEQFIAVSKSDLITLWTLLLFDHKEKEYEITAPSGETILKGIMQASDIKALEAWRICEGGACPIGGI